MTDEELIEVLEELRLSSEMIGAGGAHEQNTV